MSGSDDLGGLGDLDEGDDIGGLDEGEDLGGFDDDGFGEMEGDDAMAGGGGNIDELEHRLDELENEVGSLSSTVNTVRNENEQISNSVEEVEENVRKLLDIYEMVTRGVNPFADEMDAGMGMGGGMEAEEGSFGLFTDDDAGEEDESVDEDIADADAEGFFDDDLVDDEPDVDEEVDADVEDVFDEEEDLGAEAGDEFDGMADDGFEEDGFDDVAGEESEETADEGDAVETVDEPATEEAELEEDELFDDAVDAESGPEAVGSGPDTEEAAGTATGPGSHQSAGKPYLDGLPGSIAGEITLVEWLEYLVDEVGNRRASEAVAYYVTIDWISDATAAGLREHLDRFEPRDSGPLTAEVHRQSLAYIDQLNGGDTDTAAGVQRGDPL